MNDTKHIKTYFQMLTQILRRESDWDLMYYLEHITPQQAYSELVGIKNKLDIMAQEELTKEMNKNGGFFCKEELINTFIRIIEKQRGYPLWMWEYSDLEDWAKGWADDNGYIHLFLNDD